MNKRMRKELLATLAEAIAIHQDESRLIGQRLVAYIDELGILAEVVLARNIHGVRDGTAHSAEVESHVGDANSQFEQASLKSKEAKSHLTCPYCNKRRADTNGSSPFSTDEGVLCRSCAEVYDATRAHEFGTEKGAQIVINELPTWRSDVSLSEYMEACRHDHTNYLERLDPHIDRYGKLCNLDDLACYAGIREAVDLGILMKSYKK